MVWYRTNSHFLQNVSEHVLHLQSTWRVWYRTNSHLLHNVSKQNTASYARLAPPIYMACVAWCGIRQTLTCFRIYLNTSCTANLPDVCGMVWYRTNSHLLQNVSKQRTARYAHLSPPIHLACVAWCDIGQTLTSFGMYLTTSRTSSLPDVCGMVWYRTNSHLLQNVSKQRTARYAHLSPPIHLACVAWCDIGQTLTSFGMYLTTSRTSNLPDVCGMVWYRTNSHLLQNVSKQSTASFAHLSPPVYLASVAWCDIGQTLTCFRMYLNKAL